MTNASIQQNIFTNQAHPWEMRCIVCQAINVKLLIQFSSCDLQKPSSIHRSSKLIFYVALWTAELRLENTFCVQLEVIEIITTFWSYWIPTILISGLEHIFVLLVMAQESMQ